MTILNKSRVDAHKIVGRLRKLLISAVRAVIIIGVCFIILYPVLLDLSFVFKPERDFYDPSVIFIPKHFTLDTIRTVWKITEYPKAFMNTLGVSLVVSILQVLSSAFIGYGFARFKFPGRSLFFGLVLLNLMVPAPIILAPLYLQFNSYNPLSFLGVTGGVKLMNTLWPLTLLSITGMAFRNGIYIYLTRQFFRGIPRELDESAMIDGAGRFKIFFSIALPSAKTILITVFLFAFVWQWSDTTYTSTFMFNTKFVGNSGGRVFAYMQSTFGAIYNFNLVIQNMFTKTSAVLCMIPLLVFYIFLQKHFTESIERSGIVG